MAVFQNPMTNANIATLHSLSEAIRVIVTTVIYYQKHFLLQFHYGYPFVFHTNGTQVFSPYERSFKYSHH